MLFYSEIHQLSVLSMIFQFLINHLSEEAQWEDYFIQESAKAQELKARINATDHEIDRMVYQLYELTEEEIGIVEKG